MKTNNKNRITSDVISTIILIIWCTFSTISFGYPQSSNFQLDTTDNTLNEDLRAGSCGSPDGSSTVIVGSPPSYNWLESNGYCYTNSYGTNPTICWTFTPTSSSVSMNSGYQQLGCVNTSFNSFNLYNSSCVLIGTGLNFTGLIPGNNYTWCFTASAWGGGSCDGFTDFCPYYTNNNVPMPVNLIIFEAIYENRMVNLNWSTSSEVNNDYFIIEKFTSHEITEIGKINGNDNSNVIMGYNFIDDKLENGWNYYRLIQVDNDGITKTYDWISVMVTDHHDDCCITYYDLMGVEIDFNTAPNGMYLGLNSNGEIVKIKK